MPLVHNCSSAEPLQAWIKKMRLPCRKGWETSEKHTHGEKLKTRGEKKKEAKVLTEQKEAGKNVRKKKKRQAEWENVERKTDNTKN